MQCGGKELPRIANCAILPVDMGDRYENFAALSAQEREGVHYRVRVTMRPSPVVIVAPHGGFMERGTSELAWAIAAERHSVYCFESLYARRREHSLHITSERFDEPRALALVHSCDVAIGVHGRKNRDDPDTIWVGGLHEALRDEICDALAAARFRVKPVGDGHRLAGRGRSNICNRGRLGAGVQLETPRALRDRLLANAALQMSFAEAVRRAVDTAALWRAGFSSPNRSTDAGSLQLDEG
jgi:phage replication-related protein YjqB (UPF0714/DUF867 family)